MSEPAILAPSGDLVVSAPALSELLSVLRSHREVCRFASVPVPRWTPVLQQITGVVAEGAAAYQRRRVGAVVVPWQVGVPGSGCSVGDRAVSGSVLGEAVSVATAAQIVGVTGRRIRAMAAAGDIPASRDRRRFPGQRATRVQWAIDAAACRAHRLEREQV